MTFSEPNLKSNLQMAVSRLSLMRNKRINQISVAKEEIAGLLDKDNEEMAMIKVESVINHENFITSTEVLSMYCAQLIERTLQISDGSACPQDIRPAVETIIWASERLDCQELVEVKTQISLKFGEDFCRNAIDNRDGLVNSVVRDKLINVVPDEEDKIIKIQEIASEKRIDFVFKQQIRLEIQNAHRPVLEPVQNGNIPPALGYSPQAFPAAKEDKERESEHEEPPRRYKRVLNHDIGNLEERFKKLK